MSPLVQHKRPIRPASQPAAPRVLSGGELYLRMLFSAGLIGGISALLFGFALLMAAVGLYVIVVWPLTFWDLANLGLEALGPWIWLIITATFAGGALGGLCYFSGLFSKRKLNTRMPARPVRATR